MAMENSMLHLKTGFALGLAWVVVACSGNEPSNGVGTAGGAGQSGASMTGTTGSAGAAGNATSGAGGSAGSGGQNGAGTSGSGGMAGTGGGGGGANVGKCAPPADVFSPIMKLSETGCVDPANPTKPVATAVSYEVNSPLWSDLADKTRAFFVPAGSKIHVRDCTAKPADCPNGAADEGRWDFPVGSVMIKTFAFDSKLVETRLFMHLDAANWVGYSYQWDEAQKEATLVSSDGASVMFNTGTRMVSWHYPSQMDCTNCHNAAGGSTIGPETAQMNRTVAAANQIDKLAALGVFETPPAKPYKAALVAPYTLGGVPSAGTTEQKARSYLHGNCGFCHRPGGNYTNFDLRYDTALKDMKICNAPVGKGAIPNAPGKTNILVPGKEMDSVLWLRMNEADPLKGRMPQVGSWVVDADATKAVGDWIKALPAACP
jgi:uncharacterized repeat protein (TIGR03806 family)